jgi:hypothetical protein
LDGRHSVPRSLRERREIGGKPISFLLLLDANHNPHRPGPFHLSVRSALSALTYLPCGTVQMYKFYRIKYLHHIFFNSHHCARGQLAAVDAMVPTTCVVPQFVVPQHTQVLHDFRIGNWLLFLFKSCGMVDLDSLSRYLLISI